MNVILFFRLWFSMSLVCGRSVGEGGGGRPGMLRLRLTGARIRWSSHMAAWVVCNTHTLHSVTCGWGWAGLGWTPQFILSQLGGVGTSSRQVV